MNFLFDLGSWILVRSIILVVAGRPSPMNTLKPAYGNRPRDNQHEDAMKRSLNQKLHYKTKTYEQIFFTLCFNLMVHIDAVPEFVSCIYYYHKWTFLYFVLNFYSMRVGGGPLSSAYFGVESSQEKRFSRDKEIKII